MIAMAGDASKSTALRNIVIMLGIHMVDIAIYRRRHLWNQLI